jgi:L-lysine 2,3-aminomutase
MKEKIIEEIKELIAVSNEETIEINPKYLEYFQEEELVEIKEQLIYKKENIEKITSNYLDEIYEKTKKDEI